MTSINCRTMSDFHNDTVKREIAKQAANLGKPDRSPDETEVGGRYGYVLNDAERFHPPGDMRYRRPTGTTLFP